jgi:hypothetical protein
MKRLSALFKKSVSAEEKAEMVAEFLPGYPILDAEKLAELPEFSGDRDGDLDLLLELFAFYMHLANRLAFRELGAEQCSRFNKRLIVTVANTIATSLRKDFSSVQVIAQLRDKYNEREEYYARFPKLFASGDEPPKNTLFWEFSKVIFSGFMNSRDITDLMMVQAIFSAELVWFGKQMDEVLKA